MCVSVKVISSVSIVRPGNMSYACGNHENVLQLHAWTPYFVQTCVLSGQNLPTMHRPGQGLLFDFSTCTSCTMMWTPSTADRETPLW